jgi:hypothetical protein
MKLRWIVLPVVVILVGFSFLRSALEHPPRAKFNQVAIDVGGVPGGKHGGHRNAP